MTDALVIGGGLAGGALATRLASAGRAVILVEREAGPVDKVCGEFLSREAALYLGSLGIDLGSLGAVAIDTLRFCEGAHLAEVKLPFTAQSLSRRVLDEALLERAAAAGADIRRGTKVHALTRAGSGSASGSGWTARTDAGTLEAGATFLATGKHDLRGFKRPTGSQDDLVAFKMYWSLAPGQRAQLERHIELVLFDGGYAGLSLIENDVANLCLLVRRSRLQVLCDHETRWENLLAAMCVESPHLDARLDGATALLSKPLALSAIPYGHVRRDSDGLWRLGDQAAVIPSFSGDGMSIALHSAELAASTFLSGGDASAFQKALARDVTTQMRLATTLSQGLVRRKTQLAFGAAARLFPGLMASVAFHTRVSDAALSRVRPTPAT